MDLSDIYHHRFDARDRAMMTRVWKVLVEDCFQRWIKPTDLVLDLGAGLCLFINHVRARKKIAADANPEAAKYCAPDVAFIEIRDVDKLDLGEPIDVVFASNFFEHLDNSEAVLRTLRAIHGRLHSGGRLIILQPNFALVGASYFDFIDHKTILTDVSLREALLITGYEVLFYKKRFLPYTSKSRLPKAAWLVRLYLKFPIAQYLFGKQTLVIATPKPIPSSPFHPHLQA